MKTSNGLETKHCVPCEGGTPAILEDEARKLLSQLKLYWKLDGNKKISCEFKFKDFKEALSFINRVGDVAEGEGHHPDIAIHYNRVNIELWTHAADGLTENDFIVARKIELILTSEK